MSTLVSSMATAHVRVWSQARRRPASPLRVALATADGVHVNAALLSAPSLVLCSVTAVEFKLVGLVGCGPDTTAFNTAYRLTGRIEALRGCDILFVTEGDELAEAPGARGSIATVVVASAVPISTILADLQSALASFAA